MKKILIVMSVFALIFAVLIIGALGDDPLSPTAAKELAYTPPDVAPEDNAYVGISGLGRLGDADVVTAGLNYLKSSPQVSADDGSAQDIKFEFAYKDPCFEPGVEKCLDKIAADAQVIEGEFQSNSEILARYHKVQAMPEYVNISRFSDPIPQYQVLINTSRLINTKALLDIKQGRVDEGLKALEDDFAFYKKVYKSSNISLMDLMIFTSMIDRGLGAVSQVIADDQIDLAGYEDRLRQITQLDLAAGSTMAATLKMERRLSLKALHENEMNGELLGDSPALQSAVTSKILSLVYKKNMTINRIAAQMEESIKLAENAPMLKFNEYFQQYSALESQLAAENELSIKTLYDRYGLFFYKNYAGEVLAGISQPMYSSYLARVADTSAYAHLVRAQLELRLMPNRPEDVSAALAKLGPESLNPYTGKPFNWDKEKNTLWLASARNHDKRLEVAVPPARP